MPLGQGIVEVLRAIPPRIEVTGHGPTVRITAGSFDAALDYARERFDAPVVLDCSLRHRFWPRVTIVVTTDPGLVRSAPPLEELRRRAAQQEGQLRATRAAAHRAEGGSHRAATTQPGAATEPGDPGWSTLEEIFEGQELRRQERAARIPTQRRDSTATT